MLKRKTNTNSVWTKDFTFLSASILLDLLGAAAISFIVPLMILRSTSSVFLYGLYLVLYYSSSVFVPIFIGPLLENRNKRVINSVCCFATVIVCSVYLAMYMADSVPITVTMIIALLTGLFQAIFTVGANALILEYVEPENLQKAYSVYDSMEISGELSVPLCTFLYESYGMSFVLPVIIALYLFSAIMVFFMKNSKSVIATEKHDDYSNELKSGLEFVKNNKGYLSVCLAFMLCYMTTGIRRTTWLPYFESSYLWYFTVYSAISAGLFQSSILLYLLKIKSKHRYALSVISFVVLAIGMTVSLLFGNIATTIIAYFVGLSNGIFTNMRSVSVYENLDETQRSRFSGIFTAFTNAGIVLGMAICTVLSYKFSVISINVIVGLFLLIAFLMIYLGKDKESIKNLYNKDKKQ